ncbi:pleckstrin-like domain-containing protein [Hirsutella rhossiliensis]|uniref:Pleckstrin-like domain-containing protein n=1 Tax=Hirsutella rhossiliensis TaxID=111463 RepID=A0A9P8SH35_9HYPO|nr:pleckstrin-like domain-containing protein [Hirsutella rhossiliensis]KAH0962446.1 pleckstrin-like domain-containing protein [Hirsutella rhossiliensis]
MAEEQKPTVEVPEVAKTETAPADQAISAEAPPIDSVKPVDAIDAADAAKTEDKKDEIKPVDEGHLGHKAQGASFPKNLIPSKEFFFFGSDAVEPKSLAHYQKSEKSAETAHDNVAWASHTGKGLLFIGDKKSPHSIINLAHASEPETDGSNKFHLTAKGNKHSFKAASTPERDSWVAQLKLKIAEAKELAVTVTESETYKKTLESLKPAAILTKEEKPAEDPLKTEESARAEDAAKDDEALKEEPKEEEPKRRSASRKRASFFSFGGKKEEKKDERKSEDALAAEPAAVDAEEAPVTDAPTAAAEDKPAEEAIPAESPKDKPAPFKRNSFFGNVFSKKEKKPVDANKATEETPEIAAETDVTTTDAVAPVIPPVESTTPLAVDVSNPATVPTETVETPAINGDVKKDLKEKRKSSLPFAFGKRDKSPVPADNEEKSGMSAFSKLRATIKGKSASKAEEKPVEEAAKDESAAAEAAKETPTEGVAKELTSAPEASTTAQSEAENKPENVAATTPAVTAAA